jgi:hypothetical protein
MRKNKNLYLQLETMVSTGSRKTGLLSERSVYLQVPATLPTEVIELAKRLGSGSSEPETVLSRIQRYLAFNYTYDLEDVSKYGNRDFVHGFLFRNPSGYCVHFATSFVILARLNSIPARYTTGFLVTSRTPQQTVTVNGLSSHSWAELWLEGKGWISWEATPALDLSNYYFSRDRWLYSYKMKLDGLTARQITSFFGEVKAAEDQEESKQPGVAVAQVLTSAGGLVLGLLVFMLAKLIVRRNRMVLIQEARALLLSAYRIVELSPYRDLERSGWTGWRDRVAERYPELSRYLHRLTVLVLRSVYGGARPATRDITFSRLLLKRLKGQISHQR